MRGKRAKRLPSRSTEDVIKLPDLSEEIIIEILVRLPRNSVAQSKCLSKRWYTVTSNPDFLARFLSLQSEIKTPLDSGMIFTDYNPQRYYSFTAMSELPKSVKHRLGKRGSCTVLATYNDLVLYLPDNYYNICNLHTMQCVALPPTLPHHDNLEIAEAGFICEPYYNEQNDSTSRTFILNDEYKCRVVLIYEFTSSTIQICMDIFFSETGEWREFVVSCPVTARARYYCSIDNGAAKRSYNYSGGLAYNGKLYWLGEGGIMELDPLACDSDRNLIDRCCRFIEFQVLSGNPTLGRKYLGVCRGSMCLMSCLGRNKFEIYELESGNDDQLDEGRWCFTLATQWCLPLN